MGGSVAARWSATRVGQLREGCVVVFFDVVICYELIYLLANSARAKA